MATKRRWEILFPTRDNFGYDFPSGRMAETRQELLLAFGGYTEYRRAAHGPWKNSQGATFEDELTLVVVDADDTESNRQLVRGLKLRWTERFDQEELYVVTGLVEVL